MAVNEIIEKLNTLIASDDAFNQEKDAVYFLVQIRKLMERDDIFDDYKSIKFYCDWVLHPQKEYNHADMGSIYDDIYNECTKLYNETSDEETNAVLELMQFPSFKNDLVPLFDRYDLDKRMLRNYWIKFTKNLMHILKDQPLVNPSNKIKEIVIASTTNNIFIIKITFSSPIVDRRGYSHASHTEGLEYIS